MGSDVSVEEGRGSSRVEYCRGARKAHFGRISPLFGQARGSLLALDSHLEITYDLTYLDSL
jgi:hypothetical protein